MLRINALQNLYNLADMVARIEIIDSRAFSLFCSAELSNQILDGDTIIRWFPDILTKNNLQKRLFADLVEMLNKNDLILMKGTIADSTLIEASPSTNIKEKQRDPEDH